VLVYKDIYKFRYLLFIFMLFYTYLFSFNISSCSNNIDNIKVGGGFSMDYVFFTGPSKSRGNQYYSGVNFKSVDLYLSGILYSKYHYLLSSKTNFDGIFCLSYAKFMFNISDDIRVVIGQMEMDFGLDNSMIDRWRLFFEPSSSTSTFIPNDKMGIGIIRNNNSYYTSAFVVVPKQGVILKNDLERRFRRSDKVSYISRTVYTFIDDFNSVLHCGFSILCESGKKWVRFLSSPELNSRITTAVIDTNIDKMRRDIYSKEFFILNFESAYKYGSIYTTFEFNCALISRKNRNKEYMWLYFYGGHIEISYIFMGATRKYDSQNRNFNNYITSTSEYGILEFSSRYSFVSLDTYDIKGGVSKNITCALNWYCNDYIKISGNYIFSVQNPNEIYIRDTRKMHIFGLRVNVSF